MGEVCQVRLIEVSEGPTTSRKVMTVRRYGDRPDWWISPHQTWQ